MKKIVSTIILLCLALLLTFTASRLVIYGPQSLKDEFKSHNYRVRASYANFGNIPYGQSLIGRIYYNESNGDGCYRGNFTNDFSGDPDGILTPIFLVDRGNCSFVTKVRNVEKAGGSLAVVIDNSDEDVRDVIMSDDGTGAGIRIPSMLISKKDGAQLKKFLKYANEDEIRQASLAAEFVMQNPDNTVEWSLWYTSSNDKALDFIKYFLEDNRKFAEQDTVFTPKFVTWSCPYCEEEYKQRECVSNGKYCAMNHQGQYVQGKDIIIEDLREYCLYNTLKEINRLDDWWRYMKHVHSLCYEYINDDCSKQGHIHIGQNFYQMTECALNTFTGKNIQKDDNPVLQKFAEEWKKFGTGYWPSVVINNRTFRGDLNPDNVYSAICAGFAKLPKGCGGSDEATVIVTTRGEGISGNVLIAVVILLVIVNLILFILYRKCTNREMKEDLQLQVNSAVSQYFALSNTKGNNRP